MQTTERVYKEQLNQVNREFQENLNELLDILPENRKLHRTIEGLLGAGVFDVPKFGLEDFLEPWQCEFIKTVQTLMNLKKEKQELEKVLSRMNPCRDFILIIDTIEG